MKKTLLTLLGIAGMFLGYAQDSKTNPTAWITEGKAKNAKTLIEEEEMVTFYHCATGDISYSIENPKVKIKPSTLGEPYFDVYVIGKDQTGEKRERKIMLDQIWLETDGTYSNLADELGIEFEECTAHDMPKFLKKDDVKK